MTVLEEAIEAQAKALRDFGYSSITAAEVRDALARFKANEDPETVIDRFCFDAFRDHPQLFA